MNPQLRRTSRTILIVEDSPEDREMYRRYLLCDREYDYQIIETSLGKEGLNLWHQHQPDAVLLDYRLPDLDGLEFLAALQTQGSSLPVVMMTGVGSEAIAVQAIKAGAQDYLVKEQITPERLHHAVSGTIKTVQLQTQLQERINRERVIFQISQEVSRSLNLNEILQTTVTEVRQFLQTDRVVVFQVESDGNGRVVAESVEAEWRSLLSEQIYDPCFVERYVDRQRQGRVTTKADIHDGSIDPCHVELLARCQVKANLVVPILHDDQFWGVLIAHHCAAPRQWQPLEIDLLQQLSTQVSVAIRQAELYQQLQQELAERQRTEAVLRDQKAKLQLALEAAHMATWDWDILTNRITRSPNTEALFGLASGEFDGSYDQFVARLHPDDRDRVLEAIDAVVATGADYHIEFRVIHPNGTICWALSQGKVFYDATGQAVRMTGIDVDITDRKQAAEALQESETRFRQLAENIDAVFWLREEPEGCVSYVSPAYEHLWGWQSQELYKSPSFWVDHIHPDDRESTGQAFQSKAAAGQFDEEYRIVLADGRIRWVHDRCFPLRDQTGRVYRFAGIAEDITERKRAEAKTHQSESQLRRVLDNLFSFVGVMTPDGTLIEANRTALEAAGLSAADVLGQPFPNAYWWAYDPEIQVQLWAAIRQATAGETVRYDVQVRLGEDQFIVIDFCLAPLFNDAGQVEFLIPSGIDITDRIRAKKALQQSEEFKNRVLESSSDCIKVLDLDARLLYMNAGGIRLQEIDDLTPYLNSEWLCFWQGEHQQAAEAAFAAAKCGEVGKFQGFCPTVKGKPKWWDVVVTPMRDGAGQVVQILATSRDVTDRKQVEADLQAQTKLLQVIVSSIGDGLVAANQQGEFTIFNEAAQQMFGPLSNDRPPDQWTETYGLFLPDQHTPFPNDEIPLKRALRGERVTDVELFVRHALAPTGRWISVNAYPLVDESDEISGGIVVCRDVTERKHTEEELRQKNAILDVINESAPTPIFVKDRQGRIIYANPATLAVLGKSAAEVIGRYDSDLYPFPEDAARVMENDQRIMASGQMEVVEESPDGVQTFLGTKVPYRNEAGEVIGLIGISNNITDRVQIERDRERILQQKQAALAESERVNRIKDEFFAILSHELRSPLNPILGWTKLLQTRKLDETKTIAALETIERNAKAQCQLVDDLLDMARVLRGKLLLNSAPVDLLQVIKSAIDTVQAAAIAKSIQIYPVLSDIGQVSGDAVRLQQIVWNLLSNAIKFTPSGGRVDIRLEQVDHFAQIIITDTGKGISPNFLPHIFEPFCQEDASVTRSHGGLGLGMGIVYRLVEAHGGTVTADSPGEGKGATFTVRLRLLNANSEENRSDVVQEQPLDLTGIRVLVIDDEPDNLELLSVMLAQAGAEIMTVTAAAEFLAALVSFQPNVLVSDIGMPEVDGYTLLKQVRLLAVEQGGQIPAIALTAYAGERDQQEALAAGFQVHIAKPIEPDQLVMAIVDLLRDLHQNKIPVR